MGDGVTIWRSSLSSAAIARGSSPRAKTNVKPTHTWAQQPFFLRSLTAHPLLSWTSHRDAIQCHPPPKSERTENTPRRIHCLAFLVRHKRLGVKENLAGFSSGLKGFEK